MKGWKIGGIVSFGIVSLIYGAIVYFLAKTSATAEIFSVLKTYPVIVLIFVPIGIILGLIVSALKFFFEPKKPKRKKGQIWVSTVLYISLSLVAMTVILGAGLPMLNRMKERNTVIESKTMMHAVSDAISTVVTEGPGSRRVLDPVIIKGGKLIFDTNPTNKVRWEMKTETMLMESCPLDEIDENNECSDTNLIQREGDVEMYLLDTFVVDEYMVNLLLDYSNKGINIEYTENNKIKGPLVGSYLIAISNDGKANEKVTVGIYVS